MRYIFFISLLLLMSCGKNQFTLEFDVTPEITENYNVNYYATDHKGGLTVQAVASVREGKCLLKGATKHPTVAYLTARNAKIPLIIYADKGSKIKITGDENQPLEWLVEGDDINLGLSEWRRENLEVLKKNNAEGINAAVKKYVENNPGNPVSTILMLGYFDRSINESEYTELMISLTGAAKKKEWLKIMARADQVAHVYSYPAQLKSVVLKSENGKDTLRIDERNPVFLAFWPNGYSQRKNLVDSLKKLEKEIPDSARIIADICVDVDSISWRNVVRRDSMNTVKKLWLSYGMADPLISKLKVNSLPFYIVLKKDGKQSYRGADLKEAMKDYRELYRNKKKKETDKKQG